MVTLFTTHCPSCNALKLKLDRKGVKYNTVDDSEEVVKKGRDNGIMSAPILEVDGKVMAFSDAVKWVNSYAD